MTKARRENLKKIFAITWLFVVVLGSWSPAYVYAQEANPVEVPAQEEVISETETVEETQGNDENTEDNQTETAESTPEVIEEVTETQEEVQAGEETTDETEQTQTEDQTETDEQTDNTNDQPADTSETQGTENADDVVEAASDTAETASSTSDENTQLNLENEQELSVVNATISNVIPSGGEVYQVGDTVNISWNDASTTADKWWIHLRWTDSNGQTHQRFLAEATSKSYNWQIPLFIADTAWGEDAIAFDFGQYYKIAVCPYEAVPCAQTDGRFTINPPDEGTATSTISDVTPDGGEVFKTGETINISWNDSLTTADKWWIHLRWIDALGETHQRFLGEAQGEKQFSWVVTQNVGPTAWGEPQIKLQDGQRYLIAVCPYEAVPCRESAERFSIYRDDSENPGTGWFGFYYNYEATDPGMNLLLTPNLDVIPFGPLSAEWMASTTRNFWYDDDRLVKTGYEPELNYYHDEYFPLDFLGADDPTGETNHNYHFGARFVALATVEEEGDYEYYLLSDDDSFLYVDGQLVENRSGLDPADGWERRGTVHLVPGQGYRLDLFFAERHVEGSTLVFDFPGVTLTPCPNGVCPEDSDPTSPHITPDSLPNGTIGQSYSEDVQGVNFSNESCIDWTVQSGNLPPGLAITGSTTASTTATVYGTPTQTGTFTFTVLANSPCATEQATKTYTISIGQGGGGGGDDDPDIVPDDLPNGKEDEDYDEDLTAEDFSDDDCVTWSVESGDLPPGLSLNPSNTASTSASISGTPTEPGTYNFTIKAHSSCSDETATEDYTIVIEDDNSGGGGGGGSRRRSSTTSSAPELPESCGLYLKKYIKLGAANDPVEVRKLQVFLRDFEGYDEVQVTGFYDLVTYNAVKKFQADKDDILEVWGIDDSTGYVFISTTLKINLLYCKYTNRLSIDLRNFYGDYYAGGAAAPIAQAPVDGAVAGVDVENDANGTSTDDKATSTDNFFQVAAASFLGFVKVSWWIIIIVILLGFLAWTLLKDDKKEKDPQAALPLGPAKDKEDNK